MVVRAFVFETRGGALLQEFEPADASWSENANQAETVDVTIDLNSVTDESSWVLYGTWTEVARNLVLNPSATVGTDDTIPYSGINSTLTRSTEQASSGVASFKVSSTASSFRLGMGVDLGTPLAVPSLVPVSFDVFVPAATLPATDGFIRMQTGGGNVSTFPVSLVADEWVRVEAVLDARANSSNGRVYVSVNGTYDGTQEVYFDSFLIGAPGEFFDGSTSGSDLVRYVWDGPPDAAESAMETRTVEEVTRELGTDWRNLGTPWKHSIALDVEGRLVGGPILPHDFDDNGGQLKLTARGLRVAFGRRSILPLDALTVPLTLPNGEPDTALDSSWAGFDLGTIAKKIGQQACEWPGWTDVPIVWPDDRTGASERTYPGIERKNVDDAWSDLSDVQNGPDIRFRLEWDGPDAFRWVFETGTAAQPRLQGPDVFAWEVGQGSGLSVQTNPTRMGSLSWSQGGRADDTALVRSLYDPMLIDRGFPLLELESDASSNTVLAETLDAWNVETLRTASKPWEFWSFTIRADQSPFPFEYGPGSLIDVIVTDDSPVSGGYVPPGTYRRRVAGMSGVLSDWITITCGEVYDGGTHG